MEEMNHIIYNTEKQTKLHYKLQIIVFFLSDNVSLQSDLRPLGRKFLPSDINSGRIDKASFDYLSVDLFVFTCSRICIPWLLIQNE